MTIENIFSDKEKKAKQKTIELSELLSGGKIKPKELAAYASQAKDPVKAACIEALEFATKNNPEICDERALEFVTESLDSKAPRVKWESARVIGNVAKRFPGKLDQAIAGLIRNAGDKGTVVRWSAAFALGEILKSKADPELKQAMEKICEREEKNSIRKIYLDALKKA